RSRLARARARSWLHRSLARARGSASLGCASLEVAWRAPALAHGCTARARGRAAPPRSAAPRSKSPGARPRSLMVAPLARAGARLRLARLRLARSRLARARARSLARQHVARAAHRLDVAGLLGVVLELLAQLGHVDVDRAVERVEVLALERVVELLARQHAPRRPRQRGQELELGVGEGRAPSLDGDLARAEVDLQAAGAEARGRGDVAAEHRADARQELARVERLGQVVVGADLEPDDLVHVLALGGEHQDGDHGGVRPRTQAPADLQPVDAGEHEVEEHDLGDGLPRQRQAALAIGRHGHLDVVLAEVLGEERREPTVVLDEEAADGHVRSYTAPA